MISEERIKELVDETVVKFIKENNPVIPQEKKIAAPEQGSSVPAPTPQASVEKPKPKATIVKFDSETETPFTVKFSERGFSIGGTRLSFETLQNALSKGYNITLDQGEGLELTPVRMQKILKYEDKY